MIAQLGSREEERDGKRKRETERRRKRKRKREKDRNRERKRGGGRGNTREQERARKKKKTGNRKVGHPFEHSLPGRTHAGAVHICVYVNGCRPEFHPVPVMRKTRVTPPDLVLIRRTSTALWPAGPRVG